MHKSFVKTAAILGALSVVLGAFAAHPLKQHLTGDTISIFETGVRYQFYHVFALLVAGILFKYFPNFKLTVSISLYSMASSKTKKTKVPDSSKMTPETEEKVAVNELWKDERTHKIMGTFFLLIAFLLFVAFTSYLFTWQEDQSKV